MRVIGFNFKGISSEKKKEVTNPLSINTDINIKEIKKQEVELFPEKEIYSFDYEFKINYEDHAEINFKGIILALFDDKKIEKELEEKWKNHEIPENVKIPIMNTIFSRCNLKAMQLEEDLGLPSHLPTPRVVSQDSEKGKELNKGKK